MKRSRILVVLALCATMLLAAGQAEAANGTVRVTFKSQGAGGVEQPLSSAYLYLRYGEDTPPLEKFFRSADYIFGPSNSLGVINATSVPEGTYYVRLTRRISGTPRPLGPPEAGDYTWTDYQQITVTANTVTDLGTKYAAPFNDPITITGTVLSNTGIPLAGRYVRAQPERCIEADYSSWDPAEWVDTNRCGPVKYMAQQRTDAQGRYTILLKDPGTYFIIASRTLGDNHQQYEGNPGSTGWQIGPITVNSGDEIVLPNMNVPPYYQ